MGELTKKQREQIAIELVKFEKELSGVSKAFEKLIKQKECTWKEYMQFWHTWESFHKRLGDFGISINELNSPELPFNLFQGDIANANHTFMSSTANLGMNISLALSSKFGDFMDDGTVAPSTFEKSIVEDVISKARGGIEYNLNILRTFRKLTLGVLQVRRLNVKDMIDKAIRDRALYHHHTNFELKIDVENVKAEFDPDALYWIVMRMLSNAERATTDINEKAWIQISTFPHKDGNMYLLSRNNGKGIEVMELESKERGGGRSGIIVKSICTALGSEQRIKGFPDHTRVCLLLPVSKKQGIVGKLVQPILNILPVGKTRRIRTGVPTG